MCPHSEDATSTRRYGRRGAMGIGGISLFVLSLVSLVLVNRLSGAIGAILAPGRDPALLASQLPWLAAIPAAIGLLLLFAAILGMRRFYPGVRGLLGTGVAVMGLGFALSIFFLLLAANGAVRRVFGPVSGDYMGGMNPAPVGIVAGLLVALLGSVPFGVALLRGGDAPRFAALLLVGSGLLPFGSVVVWVLLGGPFDLLVRLAAPVGIIGYFVAMAALSYRMWRSPVSELSPS